MRKVLYVILVMWVLFIIGFYVSKLAAETHNGSIGQLREAEQKSAVYTCFTKASPKLLAVEDMEINGHRVRIHVYDMNGDGEADINAAYEFIGGGSSLRPFPTAYRIRLKDGTVREFLDVQINGRCEDIIEVPHGSTFTGKRTTL